MTVLREAHAHLFQHGRSLTMADLSACRSAEEMVERLAEARRRSTMVLAHGARPEAWDPPVWPHADQLDRIAGDAPVVAWCFDYHALVANRFALRAAGIDEDTPDPKGGIIGRDAEGRLTGTVYEHAALAVWNALPEPEPAARAAMVRAGVHDLVERHGFGEIHDLKAQPWLGPVLAELAREMNIGFRIWPLLADLEEALASRDSWESDGVRLGGAKVFVDGTLNSRTAWMLRPYADGRAGAPCGTPMMTPAELQDAVRACEAAGVPLAAHAIGDAAVRSVLDAIERVQPRTSGFRIEHCELIDEADVARFGRLGVIASVQPCHLLYDMEALRRGVPDRLDRVLPLAELIASGLEPGRGVLFGSDVPIVRADPRDSVVAATRRCRPKDEARDAVAPEQAIDEATAWACFAATGVGA